MNAFRMLRRVGHFGVGILILYLLWNLSLAWGRRARVVGLHERQALAAQAWGDIALLRTSCKSVYS